MIPTGLQDWIYKLEEGEGAHYLKVGLTFLVFLVLAAVYDIREYKNFATEEAMDCAQIARNIARGQGFTTQFVRPLSLGLMQKQTGAQDLLKKDMADVSNPPVYPYVLAGLMKVLPFKWDLNLTQGQTFSTYQPEMLVAIFNQCLFLAAIVLLFRVGKHLFDSAVAWVACIAFATGELFWAFSVSGLNTMLLIVLFLGLVLTLIHIEKGVRENSRGFGALAGLALLAGLLLGAAAMARYSMAILIFPVIGFLAWAGGPRRAVLCIAPAVVLLLCLAPWGWRTFQLTGRPFGAASLGIYQETPYFPGTKLERTLPRNLDAELDKTGFTHCVRKVALESADLIQNGVPRLGGSWLAAFFLVSLVVAFKSELLKKMRIFLVGCLVFGILAQALGKTHLTLPNSSIHGENLLAIFAPLAFVFGAGMFFILIDAIEWTILPLRSAAIGAFLVVLALPLILLLLPPREATLAYPPYYPPIINETASWMKSDELMMSDMPWAVAWYGDRKCLWTTLDAGSSPQGDFFAINDYMKPVQGLFLSPMTMDKRFLTEIITGKEGAWGRFVLDSLLRTNVPAGFPLKQAPKGFLPYYLFLSDRNRWKKPGE